METVAEFVQRTDGPAVPFVADWYPWVYAHHYLRLEATGLPSEVRHEATISPAEARELIYLWCGLSGESVQSAAQLLADAYLRRWGMDRADRESTAAPVPAGRRRTRDRRPGLRISAPRGRIRRALVQAG